MCRPQTLDEAWQIQRALDRRAGGPIGWKLAATSPAGRQHIGADGPLLGRLYDRCLVPSGAELVPDELTMQSAEAEFVFRIAEDLDGPPGQLTRESVVNAIESVHPGIEVPDSRFDDFRAVGLPSLVADGMCAAFLVVGAPVTAWEPPALPEHAVAMRRNGEVVTTGCGANVLGDPCEALVWAANELNRLGVPIRTGDIVTTGACTPPNAIAAGDELVADFGDFGAARVSFAAGG